MSSPRFTFFAQLGMRDAPLDAGADYAIEMDVNERVINPRGGLQGGLVATLIDIAAGKAALDGTEPPQTVATSSLNVSYLGAVTVGPARAQATVLRRGRNVVVVDVKVYDIGREKLAAVSTATFAVLTLRDGQVDPGRTGGVGPIA